ncbi:hypothetical protein D3C80_553680 [compost metagenome]
MADLQRPDAILAVAGQARQGAERQTDVELIMLLVIVKLDNVDKQLVVVREAVPNAHLCQQATDEGKVTFTVLHDLFTLGVFASQVEQKVLTFELVAAAQDALDDFWNRLVLVDPVLFATAEQRQASLQGHLITGFIFGAGEALETRDHTMQRA